ncbi:MAG: hypothetical protein Q8L47_00790, partial [bacterium]|nr:hypothetical protein [bacterium]
LFGRHGSVNVLLIVLVVVLFGVVGYFVLLKKDEPIVQPVLTSSPIASLVPTSLATPSVSAVKTDLQLARETLIQFYKYLNNKEFEKAVVIFEPDLRWWWWEYSATDVSPLSIDDRNKLDWNIALSKLDPIIKNISMTDKIKSLSYFCNTASSYGDTSRCPLIAVLKEKKNSDVSFTFTVRFIKKDGKVYNKPQLYGVAGEDNSNNPGKQFEMDYIVKKIGTNYKVVTPPFSFVYE